MCVYNQKHAHAHIFLFTKTKNIIFKNKYLDQIGHHESRKIQIFVILNIAIELNINMKYYFWDKKCGNIFFFYFWLFFYLKDNKHIAFHQYETNFICPTHLSISLLAKKKHKRLHMSRNRKQVYYIQFVLSIFTYYSRKSMAKCVFVFYVVKIFCFFSTFFFSCFFFRFIFCPSPIKWKKKK